MTTQPTDPTAKARALTALPITVKHACKHYQLHLVNARDDRQAAIIEAELSREVCSDCKEEQEQPHD